MAGRTQEVDLQKGKSRGIRSFQTSEVWLFKLEDRRAAGACTSVSSPIGSCALLGQPIHPPKSKCSICLKTCAIESGNVGKGERRRWAPPSHQIVWVFNLLPFGNPGHSSSLLPQGPSHLPPHHPRSSFGGGTWERGIEK